MKIFGLYTPNLIMKAAEEFSGYEEMVQQCIENIASTARRPTIGSCNNNMDQRQPDDRSNSDSTCATWVHINIRTIKPI